MNKFDNMCRSSLSQGVMDKVKSPIIDGLLSVVSWDLHDSVRISLSDRIFNIIYFIIYEPLDEACK